MKAQATALIPGPDTRGQCQASRSTNYNNDTSATDRQCLLSARFIVGGKRLCSKHAGIEALNILLEEPK